MTSLPPAGWYPDPEAGGTQWRWWYGDQWAPPSFGYNVAVASYMFASYRNATIKYGRWMRWAVVGAAVGSILAVGVFALVGRGNLSGIFPTANSTSPPRMSGGVIALNIALLPLQLLSLASLGVTIAWIYNAGKFAELQRWPAARGRTLGAFSLLIPIVNFWWPYGAVRDCFPPWSRPEMLLRWWLSYLLVPFGVTFSLFLVGFFAPVAVAVVAFAVGACLTVIPVRLGWQVIDAVEAVQRAHSPY